MLPTDPTFVTVDNLPLTRMPDLLWTISKDHRNLAFDSDMKLKVLYVYRHAMIRRLLDNDVDPETIRQRTFYRTTEAMHDASRRLYINPPPNFFEMRYNPGTALGR